jgi:hypothetical protein
MIYDEQILAREYKKADKKNGNIDLIIAFAIYFLFN